ncbi:hypothetical protein C5167_013846 [Papaver somniferum]|uniref:RRM domain-containing protein n=1 Tax=Papaver somniferum TaxID=3469 RepID=A0A4Y7J1I3_PAPSO|nr:hypothetical protein C5167_013846 [Papaver somniferum]
MRSPLLLRPWGLQRNPNYSIIVFLYRFSLLTALIHLIMADSPRRRNDALNPGNTLYVTGLSSRVTERDLEDHFSKEGKVSSCRLVMEPRTQISRGFAFVTMDNVGDADRCIKHLNQSVLEGRCITVEKSRRKRPRTPTPGNYLGAKSTRETGYRGDRGRYRGGGGGYGRDEYRRSPRRSPPYRGGRDYSPPRRSPYGGRHYSPPPRRSPYGGGRSRRERSRSYGGPERGYGRRPDVYSR